MRIISLLLFSLATAKAIGAEPSPPWPARYKIKPHETSRLTAADLVGPDGIFYPNWTLCGVQGGIPQVQPAATLEQFGGKPNDELDDAPALDQAAIAAGRNGGGAVILGEGTYYLDRPVTIRQDKVVIRGQGRDRTRVIVRYAVPKQGAFFWPPANARVGSNTHIELHCQPTNLMKMTILADDLPIRTWERSQHSGNTFSCTATGRDVVRRLANGPHTLKGISEYRDSTRRTCEIRIIVDSAFPDSQPVPSSAGAITFQGQQNPGPALALARDGKRGDRTLQLDSVTGLSVGDSVLIDGPATERWKTLTKNACKWGNYRHYEARIEKIDGRSITLNQPLRIEFPVIDGSYVRKIAPIQFCGIENLYIEQKENLWITTVLFSRAWNCWARGVTVHMCGRNPVYGLSAKWCEIRDCVFDDAWFKGGGGTAYTGWEMACDCLMENVETFKFRHAPLFQWAASGNVIRKSVFRESDAQWHSGWTNENLIEQCIIESALGNGGYGFGAWASPPEDAAHGPNGPRNVVYNCDFRSPKAGLWMGGMNENWLILHNRFFVDSGPGVQARTSSFDHIIRGNVFILKDGRSPMVLLSTPDCIGVEIADNQLYGGNGQAIGGKARAVILSGNQIHPPADAPRPRPRISSIYEWQQSRK